MSPLGKLYHIINNAFLKHLQVSMVAQWLVLSPGIGMFSLCLCGVFPQSKVMQIRLTSYTKLPIGVNVGVNDCQSLCVAQPCDRCPVQSVKCLSFAVRQDSLQLQAVYLIGKINMFTWSIHSSRFRVSCYNRMSAVM